MAASPWVFWGGAGGEALDVGAQGAGLAVEVVEALAGQDQHGAGGDGFGGVVPGAAGAGEDLLAEVVAVGEDAEGGGLAVFAGADLGDLVVGDEHDFVGGLPGGGDDVAGGEFALGEPVGQGGEHGVVLEAAQGGQFAQFAGDDPDLGAGGDEGDPAVADGVAQPPVHPVGAQVPRSAARRVSRRRSTARTAGPACRFPEG
jgi:hypothetical protein